MRFSSEIRWFIPGSAPTDVLDWFDRLGSVARLTPRTDYYLDPGGSTAASVKLVGDRVQCKTLCPPPPVTWQSGEMAGLRNQWLKWSCVAAGADLPSGELPQDTRCLAVWKSRSMRRFGFAPDGAGVMVLDSADGAVQQGAVQQGCEVELTTLRVMPVTTLADPPSDHAWEAAEQWWSLALETFGERAQLIDHLDLVAGMQLNPPPPVALEAAASAAYPAWLAAHGLAQAGDKER